MQKPIVVVGSINLDLVVSAPYIPAPGETILGTDFETFFGGKGANQAVAAARLGAPTMMIGAVGSDAAGDQLLRGLKQAGVDTAAIAVVPGSSGTALITRGSRGENSIIVVPGANAAVMPEHIDRHLDLLTGAAMILLQLEIPMETVAYAAHKASEMNVPVMLDPAPARAIPEAVMRKLAWLTPNETEQQILLNRGEIEPEDAARMLLAAGVRNVALKLGSQGVYLSGNESDAQRIAAFPVEAVDTTAAGDVFNAAFAVGLTEAMPAAVAARFASAAAAISVTRPGAQASTPTRAEVQNFLSMQIP